MTGASRIVLVSTYYHPVIGGAEAAAARFAGFLVARGHQVIVLTKRIAADHQEHERVDGVPVWRRPPAGRPSGFAKWVFLPWVFTGLWKLRADYDVILVFDQRGTGLPALLVARLLQRPLVIQPHTQATLDGRHPLKQGWRDWAHRLATWPLRQCYGRADAIACITRSIMAEGRRLGVNEERLHYQPNPVDIARFTPADAHQRAERRARYGLPPSAVLFVFTGRLSREKGLRELLSAWSSLETPDAHLLLIGPDMPGHPWNEGPWLRDFVDREHLSERVTFLGRRSQTEVAEIQSACDVALLPSHFEAHPVAGIEAMASGLPLIASRVGGVPDFLEDGVNGLLVEPRDAIGLASAISRAAQDAEWRARAGKAARHAAEPFAQDLVLERFEALLDRVARTAT